VQKRYSDNPSVEKAFNATSQNSWIFLVILIFTIILGLYVTSQFNQPALPLIGIFGSILLVSTLYYFISKKWFRFWLQRVSDPAELYQRAIRLYMMFPGTAKRIAKDLNINVSQRQWAGEALPTIQAHKKVLLSNTHIVINGISFALADISDFYFSAVKAAQTTLVVIQLRNQSQQSFSLNVRKPFELEYQIDKYLNNAHRGLVNPSLLP
jgi:hypothetical protein